jgi:glycosyltransferase involved in cell wall biosynthesis
MKVAHLDTARTWRGGQAQIAHLMRGLAARGVESLLLAPPGPLLERMRGEGFETVAWPARGEWDVGAVIAARGALARAAPDVAHCHSAHAHALGVPAARWAKTPVVVVSRRVDFAVGEHFLSALKYRMPVDRYLCISRGVMRVLERAGVPPERLALVPSGIEPPATSPGAPAETAADLRETIGVPAGARIVGTVAALAPHKNHADLLRAAARVAARLPDVHFAWIGAGECHAALLAQRGTLGLESRVHLLGFRPDARGLMRQFTVFALSSYLEGLCTSLLDAQMRGVPIVATAVGGIPEVVEDGRTGRLVPGRDPDAFADALIEALEHPERAAAWAENARQAVRAFSADAMVERTLEQYRLLLAGTDARPPR